VLPPFIAKKPCIPVLPKSITGCANQCVEILAVLSSHPGSLPAPPSLQAIFPARVLEVYVLLMSANKPTKHGGLFV
jgi:hypothetical protein